VIVAVDGLETIPEIRSAACRADRTCSPRVVGQGLPAPASKLALVGKRPARQVVDTNTLADADASTCWPGDRHRTSSGRRADPEPDAAARAAAVDPRHPVA